VTVFKRDSFNKSFTQLIRSNLLINLGMTSHFLRGSIRINHSTDSFKHADKRNTMLREKAVVPALTLFGNILLPE